MMIKQPYLEEILQELNETFENFDQKAEKLALEIKGGVPPRVCSKASLKLA